MKVAIAGYGAEGQSSYRYFVGRGDDVTIVTNKVSEQFPIPDGAQAILADDAFDRLNDFDLVLRTPPMRPDSIATRGKVWSATNEFFAMSPAPIIGVTGTKGKGTTSSLIASILRAGGKTVHLVGNIGQPALNALPSIQPGDIVVYELSSFQLWDLERSPHVAVVLGIEPDHLDVHGSFEEYIAAKANIAAHQTPSDTIVYNVNNQYSARIAGFSAATKIPYPFDISDVSTSLQIPGVHNIENASAAIAACREYVADPEIIKQGLTAFTGLPHRLKFIREISGVGYYDDNYSSAPGSTLAAVRAFEVPEVLIAGGYDKGVDLLDLVAALSQQANLKHIILIGQTGPQLKELFWQNDYHNVTLLEGKPSMQAIVETATEQVAPGDVVIMSPACASFDMFKNFADRGDQFVAAVEAL